MGDTDGLKPGPRDHLVTRALERLLQTLDPEVREDAALDPAEGPERLDSSRNGRDRAAAGGRRECGRAGGPAQRSAAADRVRRGGLGSDRGRRAGEGPVRDQAALKPGPSGRPAAVAGDAIQPERPPGQRRGSAEHRLRAEGRAGDRRLRRSDLRVCDLVGRHATSATRSRPSSLAAAGCGSITTTYMGATEKRAVDELFSLGAEIRVAFDARTTKLHAKAWLLERDSGLTTAFVGSSNLSHTALFDGLEWNVRLVVDGRGTRHRARPDDVREPLGLRALRALRPRRERRRACACTCGVRPAVAGGILDDLVRATSTCGRIRISSGCSTR